MPSIPIVLYLITVHLRQAWHVPIGKIRQLRDVDKGRKMILSVLASFKIKLSMKYYRLHYNCFKPRIKIQSKVIKSSNKCIINKGPDLASSPGARKRLEPGLHLVDQ